MEALGGLLGGLGLLGLVAEVFASFDDFEPAAGALPLLAARHGDRQARIAGRLQQCSAGRNPDRAARRQEANLTFHDAEE